MEKRFECDRTALRQSRITFWFYVVSIPIIIFLFLLPFIRAGQFVFSPYSIVYIGIILYLIYAGYRSMLVMNSIKHSYCAVEGDRISGVSTPDPYKKAIPFELDRRDILGIGKTTVSAGGMRSYPALVINTADQKIVLLTIEHVDELKQELDKRETQE